MNGNDPIYADTAKSLGKQIATAGYGLVYGGCDYGLMGHVSWAAHENNCEITSIVEQEILDLKQFSVGPGKVVKVQNNRDFMDAINEHSTAFVILPGGFTTLEEILQCLRWSHETSCPKPIVVINVNGYYDSFKSFIENGIACGIIDKTRNYPLFFCDTPAEAINAITKYCSNSLH
ncbi:hypothetical protein IWW40_005408 [Coemansia sp. RSA 1250]|nr:hypothetical protein IWW40_005408 [Coemansia sp. RSA 1250]